ncbi:glycosyltransferase family 2 protein [Paenibacillus tarimensis]
MNGLTSIIIPTYNCYAFLHECIESIQSYTEAPYEIIVVDNGSTDHTLKMLKEKEITFISLPENKGFPAACNYGIRFSRGDTVLLLNNDVLVRKRWLENMLDCLFHAGDIGIVGPVSNYASGKQQTEVPFTNVDDMALRFGSEHKGRYEQVHRIVGLCFLFRRELMDRVGLLDEQFSPGHFEDDDYCYRARLAGYRLMIAHDAFVFHHGSASFGRSGEEAVKQLIARNRQKFMEKWAVDPLALI